MASLQSIIASPPIIIKPFYRLSQKDHQTTPKNLIFPGDEALNLPFASDIRLYLGVQGFAPQKIIKRRQKLAALL